MVRWVSDSSLRQDYAKWLEAATQADVSCVNVNSMPMMDDDTRQIKSLHFLRGLIEAVLKVSQGGLEREIRVCLCSPCDT